MINSNKTRRYEEALRVDTPDKQSRENECDFPNCCRDGLYKAPKGPKKLRDYYYFCLEHVRDYNRSWNFNEGLNEEELEQMIRRSTTWERPSWPFGARQAEFSALLNNEIRDILLEHTKKKLTTEHIDKYVIQSATEFYSCLL